MVIKESQYTITLPPGKDITKERLTCDLCGETKPWPEVDLYCGGPFGYLCKTCAPIVEKVIEAYLDMLTFLPFNVVIGTLSAHIKKKEKKTR